MKKQLTILSGLFLTLNLCAQTIKTTQTVKTIVQQRSIYLNGGARSTFGGKSRTTIPISLPKNTVSWYYSFSTSPGESGTKNLNLFAQLSTLALDPTGLTKAAVSSLKVPSGSASIDVYLLDQNNSDLFIQKVDNNGGNFTYIREGFVTNTNQAIVPIYNTTTGLYYIGLKNPSKLDGVNISIEVVAVVQEAVQQTEEQLQAFTMGNLGWKAFERGDYDRCIELSKQALALDNSLGFVHFNIALSHLIKGQNSEAVTQYSKAISTTKKSMVPKRTFEGAIGDLKTYMDKFPSKADAQDILDLLTQELKYY